MLLMKQLPRPDWCRETRLERLQNHIIEPEAGISSFCQAAYC